MSCSEMKGPHFELRCEECGTRYDWLPLAPLPRCENCEQDGTLKVVLVQRCQVQME